MRMYYKKAYNQNVLVLQSSLNKMSFRLVQIETGGKINATQKLKFVFRRVENILGN